MTVGGKLTGNFPETAREEGLYYSSIRMSVLTLAICLLAADPWPDFRGPRGDGTSEARDIPLAWSEASLVRWKTPIHGRGWSTPAVGDGKVWLTTATEDGKEMSAVGVDLATGRILLDLVLFRNESPQPLGNPVNSYASPSPVVEEGRVWVHFGSYGTACLDASTGKVIWERRDLPCNHFRGPGSSPFLFGDLLILTMDGFDVQYLVALETGTGKTVWKTERSFDFGDTDGDLRKAYSTPLVVRIGGEPVMFSPSAKAAYAYDPRDGRELWRIRYDGFSNASRPVFGAGLVFINTGFGKADLWAVRPDGRGDVTDTHVVWKCTQGVPLKPSPVVVGDLIFMGSDNGIATCLEAATGRQVWQARLGGDYSASPLAGAGRVYFFSEEGKTTVIEPGRAFRVLATSRLDAGFMASPAVAGRALILRTKTHLYRIED